MEVTPPSLPRSFPLKIGPYSYIISFVARMPKGHHNDWGICDPPTNKKPRIRIQRKQGESELMETIIHEVFHARCFDLSEEAVDEAAKAATQVLLRLGYHR